MGNTRNIILFAKKESRKNLRVQFHKANFFEILPGKQEQLNDPSLLMQIWSHPPLFSAHSSISEICFSPVFCNSTFILRDKEVKK